MFEAPSLQSISRNLAQALEPHTEIRETPDFKIDINVGFARPGVDLPEVRWRKERVRIDQVSKLAGILFCLPSNKFGRDEILQHLDYFNERSEEFVEFYCAGYGYGWPPGHHADKQPVLSVDGKDWSFSNKAFNELRIQIASKTKWVYSGETDLILLTANRGYREEGYLSPTSSLACNLEQMARDKAFTSVRAFLESIAQLGETYDGKDPVARLSNTHGGKAGVTFLEDAILSKLPKPVSDLYRSAKHFAVQDISK